MTYLYLYGTNASFHLGGERLFFGWEIFDFLINKFEILYLELVLNYVIFYVLFPW